MSPPDARAGDVPVLELGGTHVTAAMVDLAAGQVVPGTSHRRQLDGDAPAPELLEQIVKCASELDAPPGAPWGAAVPGPFDYASGIARFEGVGKFDALNGVDIGDVLLRRLPNPPSRVSFLNDAVAFTLGEWAFGAGAGHERLVGITLGSGVGSGFLSGGLPVAEGPTVPPDGEVYQLTVDDRPLEDTVSRRALLRAYHQKCPDARGVDVRDIAARAQAGDVVARQVLDVAFTRLGEALAPWLVRFHATALVVGGSISRSWDLLHPALLSGIQSSEGVGLGHLQILPARDPEHSAMLGAAWRASNTSGRIG